MWCVVELIYANRSGLFPTKTYVTGPDAFAKHRSSALDAQESKLQDRDRTFKSSLDREEIDRSLHEL